MARGHFEVFPVLGDVGRVHAGGEDPDKGAPLEGPVGYAWRFVDEHGKHTARSEGDFGTTGEAKLDVARFVGQVRQATYGQRFDAEIADAVIEVEQ